jgi:hypothetical protein
MIDKVLGSSSATPLKSQFKLVYNISDDKVSSPIFIRMAVNPEHVGSIVDVKPQYEVLKCSKRKPNG